MRLSEPLSRWGPWLALAVLPALVHAPLWLLRLSADPIYWTSWLSEVAPEGPLPGYPGWYDPNAGVTTQALGGYAARQWLHGVVPWWNPFAGVGMPLVAEAQPAPLFLPFTLLLALRDGVLWNKIALQAVAGLATYGLLRELALARRVALLGGALFELNGTFAWFAHAPINPVPFLPLLLLGIARAARFARAGRPGGWGWIASALAFSLYAGFPEVAFIDGLLAACWAGWWIVAAAWRRTLAASVLTMLSTAARIAAGGVCGLLLAGPVALPFLQALPSSDIGQHATLGDVAMAPNMWASLLAPYAQGPFEGFAGGYLGAPLVWLALLALTRPGRHIGPRVLLAAWIVLAIGKSAQWRGLGPLLDRIPFLRQAAVFLYAVPSYELACVLLACLALQDWLDRGPPARLARLAAGALVMVALGGTLWLARGAIASLTRGEQWLVAYPLASVTAAVGALALVSAPPRRPASAWRSLWLGCALAGYAAALFATPLLSGTRKPPLDRALVAFLREHLGLGRFYTLGPSQPNWGTPFGIASINHNALPVPRAWVDYIHAHLDPGADSVSFVGYYPVAAAGEESRASALRRRLDAFAATGVAYVVAPAGANPFADPPDIHIGDEDGADTALPLGPRESISADLPAGRLPSGDVAEVEIGLGPGAAAAGGTLSLEICGWRHCGGGVAAVTLDGGGEALAVTLRPALRIDQGEAATIRLSRGVGEAPIALRLWPPAPADGGTTLRAPAGRLAGRVPGLVLRYAGPPAPPLVFHSPVADIYQAPNPAPYAEARGAACALIPTERERIATDCAGPATLVRRELFDPGWRAEVNGAAVPVARADEIFQSVAVPRGPADVRFRYAPPGIGWAEGGALLGLAGLGAGLWRGRARRPQNRTESASDPN